MKQLDVADVKPDLDPVNFDLDHVIFDLDPVMSSIHVIHVLVAISKIRDKRTH